MIYLQKIKTTLDEFRIVRPERFVPCTEQEVKILEEKLLKIFPQSYREFLLWMGKGAGGILGGSECFYSQLIPIQKDAVELLKENNFSKPLPEDAFVFLMHQGYQFNFFHTTSESDPEVYFYSEGKTKDEFSKDSSHYSDFLQEIVMGDAMILREFAEHPTPFILSSPIWRESVEYYRRMHGLD